MKTLIIFASILLFANAHVVFKEWLEFKLKHGKVYNTEEDNNERLKIFEKNLHDVESHNEKYARGEVSYKKAINKFSDQTPEELAPTLSLKSVTQNSSTSPLQYHAMATGENKVPADVEINYVKQGLVTSVKNQGGSCGSCWAFSAVGAIEGQVAKLNGTLESLSVQKLVDCSREDGCKGGQMMQAFKWISIFGIFKDIEYPYVSGETGIGNGCKKLGGMKISGYKQIPEGDEVSLLDALVNVGPISISIEGTPLHAYGSGIIDKKSSGCKGRLDHGVLLVGAGVENGIPYYLMKNSWGEDWGMNGYFKMRRGEGVCGLDKANSYPIL